MYGAYLRVPLEIGLTSHTAVVNCHNRMELIMEIKAVWMATMLLDHRSTILSTILRMRSRQLC